VPPANLPPDVVRVLSFHGPVDVFVGEGVARGRAHPAPFDDVCYLMVPVGAPLEAGMLASVQVEVHARHKDGDYALRMTGRAHPGRTVGHHKDRSAIEPWMPEGGHAGRLLAAPFVPEHIELVRNEGEGKARYHGETPAGRDRPRRVFTLARAAFGGISLAAAVLAVVVPWVWITIQGPEYPSRAAALALQIAGGLSLLASTRLAVLALGFRQWRAGRARARDAPILDESLLSFRETLQYAGAVLVIAIAALGTLSAAWEPDAMLVGLLPGCAWLLGPAWALHLLLGKPEARS
jgi:hypothetical protein